MNAAAKQRTCYLHSPENGLARHLESILASQPDWQVLRVESEDVASTEPGDVGLEIVVDQRSPSPRISAKRWIRLVLSQPGVAPLEAPQTSQASDGSVTIQLPPMFGKWCDPDRSPVAAWCRDLAQGTPPVPAGPEPLRLVYIDDVVEAVLAMVLDDQPWRSPPLTELPGEGWLDRLLKIDRARRGSRIPRVWDPVVRRLDATYLSWLPPNRWLATAEVNRDERGWLAELVKVEGGGQCFISTTEPGITRGNHFHHTKVERFCLLRGEGVVRLREVGSQQVIEIPVQTQPLQWVDIPPGHTHSIENTGSQVMVVLFWANEVFDPRRPDTYSLPVLEVGPESPLGEAGGARDPEVPS